MSKAKEDVSVPGSWETKFVVDDYSPNIHAIALSDGRLLFFGRSIYTNALRTRAYVWDPLQPPFPSDWNTESIGTDLFCCGHSALADGTILTVGGGFLVDPSVGREVAPKHLCRYDPMTGINGTWTTNPPSAPWNMNWRRWYPTSTTLWDGHVLLMAGWSHKTLDPVTFNVSLLPEVFEFNASDPQNSTITSLGQLQQNLDEYPWMFQAPNGNVFFSGPSGITSGPVGQPAGPGESRYLITHDTSTNPPTPLALNAWTWSGVTYPKPAKYFPSPGVEWYDAGGSVAMYDAVRGRILKCGGIHAISETSEAHNLATTIDLSASSPAWDNNTPNMHFARRNVTLVLLPTGQVLAVGGNKFGSQYVNSGNLTPEPVMEAEIFTPNATGTGGSWARTFVNMTDPRYYHSVAILLQDARVLVTGGETDGVDSNPNPNPPPNPYPYTEHSGQIFKPPYLDNNPARPVILSSPGTINYGQGFTVTLQTAMQINKVALTKLGAVTHGFDHDQRYVSLSYTRSGATLAITAPANGRIAPPGYYFLWVMAPPSIGQTAPGVPCTLAAIVKVA